MNKIQIKNITKKYNNLTALDDVSFSFEFGKIYGLLGRNGAGKSTLINIIANRIFADEGMILVDDIPAKENMQVQHTLNIIGSSFYTPNSWIANLSLFRKDF